MNGATSENLSLLWALRTHWVLELKSCSRGRSTGDLGQNPQSYNPSAVTDFRKQAYYSGLPSICNIPALPTLPNPSSWMHSWSFKQCWGEKAEQSTGYSLQKTAAGHLVTCTAAVLLSIWVALQEFSGLETIFFPLL